LRLFSFGGYGLALATLALVVFGAYDSYPFNIEKAYPIGAERWPRKKATYHQAFVIDIGNT